MKSYFAVSLLIIGALVVGTLAREPQTVLSRNMIQVNSAHQMSRHNQRLVEASNNVQELDREVTRIRERVDTLYRDGRRVEGARLHLNSRNLRAQAEWPVPGRTVQSPLPLPRRH